MALCVGRKCNPMLLLFTSIRVRMQKKDENLQICVGFFSKKSRISLTFLCPSYDPTRNSS